MTVSLTVASPNLAPSLAAVRSLGTPPQVSAEDLRRVTDLPHEEIAVALAASDMPTLPVDALDLMEDVPELNDSEQAPAPMADIAALLTGWALQGIDRLGGEDSVWESARDERYEMNAAPGDEMWQNSDRWGTPERGRQCYMLAWNFHPWADSVDPQPEIVTVWTVVDPEYPEDGLVGTGRPLRDLRMIERANPGAKLSELHGNGAHHGFVWVKA